jgi:hypothetical protein
MLGVVCYFRTIIHYKKSNQMTEKLREFLSGMAMQGLCVNFWQENVTPTLIAEQAVKIADALIEELKKSNK